MLKNTSVSFAQQRLMKEQQEDALYQKRVLAWQQRRFWLEFVHVKNFLMF